MSTRDLPGVCNSGAFDREIVSVEVAGRKGPTIVLLDKQPAKGDGAKHGQKRGRASLCIGGGKATTVAVELMN